MTIGAPGWEWASRPAADAPLEYRGGSRDGVRLLVTRGDVSEHRAFVDLGAALRPGDLLVVNQSATIPASVPARASFGEFRVSLCTRYGDRTWLVEPRWSMLRPGPVPLRPGDEFVLADLPASVIAPYPGLARLWFVRIEGDILSRAYTVGSPIRYHYTRASFPLDAYQTAFSRLPGSVEMPSAGRPFTPPVLRALDEEGVAITGIVLHAGVSSLDNSDGPIGRLSVLPEPFSVPGESARTINRVRKNGGRVVAVGTTVVRALETAREGDVIRPTAGFTRTWVAPERGPPIVDGLLTGFHEPGTTHLSMLESFLGAAGLRRAYGDAIAEGYLWHEFGDSHLIFRG